MVPCHIGTASQYCHGTALGDLCIGASHRCSIVLEQCYSIALAQHRSIAFVLHRRCCVELCGIALLVPRFGITSAQCHIGISWQCPLAQHCGIVSLQQHVGAALQHCVDAASCSCSVGSAVSHWPLVPSCSITLFQCRSLWHRVGAALKRRGGTSSR